MLHGVGRGISVCQVHLFIISKGMASIIILSIYFRGFLGLNGV